MLLNSIHILLMVSIFCLAARSAYQIEYNLWCQAYGAADTTLM